MMLFSMPPYEIGTINDLSVSRADHDRARMQLGRAELRAAARILRKLWGGPAVRLIVEENLDEEGDRQITALALFHANGKLIWFNQESDAYQHPGAAEISDDKGVPRTSMDTEVVSAIEIHIGAAYAAMDGTGLALEAVRDRRLSKDGNLLELDLDVALMTDQADQRRLKEVMDTLELVGRFGRHFGGPEPTEQELLDIATDVDADLFPYTTLADRQANHDTPEDAAADQDWIDQFRAAYDRGRSHAFPGPTPVPAKV